MNPLRRISEELLNHVVALALTKARAAVLKAVSQVLAQQEKPTKVVWQKLPPPLLRTTVLRAGQADNGVAQLLVTTWLQHSGSLRDAVWAALQRQGYAPAIPPPASPVPKPSRLRAADLHTIPHPLDNERRRYYFWPAGQSLLGEAQDEAVSLMAYLLGWSVLDDADEAPHPPATPAEPVAAPPEARPLVTLQPALQAIVDAYRAGTFQPSPGEVLAEANTPPGEELAAFAGELADELTAYAQQLRGGELPATLAPAEATLAQLHSLYEARFISLSSHLGPVELPPPAGRTVAHLQELTTAVREASQGPAVREAAVAQLGHLARLRHRSLPEFAPLLEVQQKAAVLAEELLPTTEAGPVPAVATALQRGTHPFCLLLQLVADAQALDELDEQSTAFQALEEELPRALVTALLLRKLELPAVPPATDDEPAAAEAVEPAPLPAAPIPPDAAAAPAGESLAATDAAEQLPALQWQLLAEPRLALAWQLTRAAGSAAPALPASLLRALLLAPALHHPTGELAQTLTVDFAHPPTEATSPNPLATRLLEVAAALRPALLAPDTQATRWLPADLPQLPALQTLVRLVASRPATTPLLPALGFAPLSQSAWATRLNDWRTALAAWQEGAAQAAFRQLPTHPATQFWQHLLQPEQPGGQLLHNLQARGPAAPLLPLVQASMARMSAHDFLDTQLPVAGYPLHPDHPARHWLRQVINELVDFASQWRYLRSIQPGRGNLSHLEAQDKAFCQQLAAALPPARHELSTLLPQADPALRTALPWLEAALTQLQALLHHPLPAGPEATLTALTETPLLPYATLPLDLTGHLPAPHAPWLPALQAAALAPEPGWTEAFASHLGRGQHHATARILALPGAGIGASGEALALLHEAHTNGITDQKNRLEILHGQLRQDIELATRRGQLTPAQRTQLLQQNAHRLHRNWQYADANAWAIDYAAMAQELADTIASLRAAEAENPPAATPGPTNALFTRFFPQQLHLLEHELETHPLPELLARLAQGGTVAGTALHPSPAAMREAAGLVLGAWEELRAERSVRAAQVPEVELLLAFLGFEAAQVSLPPRIFQGPDVADATTRRVTSCPVPYYGSAAAGRYRLVFVWQKTADAAQLLDEARKGTDEANPIRPVLLFYFNSLSESQRHDLASHSRQRRQPVLVLDRTLLLWLATAGLLQPDRLLAFFQLTLPFSWLEPFPAVAPELFAGRRDVQELLLDAAPNTPSMVLGAPGTGKTALFRQLATQHQPAEGQLVFLINVAQLTPAGQLAGALERELKRLLLPHGLLPAGMAAGLSLPKMLRYVRTWLHAQPHRRLILLLDDVAELVRQELAADTPLLRQLAELMAETDLRCKVIMSAREWPGSQLPNQALHLSSLTEPTDAGAAETLLRRPLESLGLVFEQEESVSVTLVATGYLPQQLQLLGQRLLAHIYGQPQPAPGERPAYRLSPDDVRTVLRAAEADTDEVIQEFLLRTPHHYLGFLLLSSPAVLEQFGGTPGLGLRPLELWQAGRHYWPAGFVGPDAALPAHYHLVAHELTVAGLALCAADGRYFLTESCWRKMGSTQEMAAELAGFAARAQETAEVPAAAGRPAPAASKSSMLKRLTNGRRRL